MDLSALLPRAEFLAVAVAADAVLGDPVYRGHPIRLMGRSVSWCEKVLRRAGADGRLGGCILVVVVASAWTAGTSVLILFLGHTQPQLATAMHLLLLYSLLALGDLIKHGNAVHAAASSGELGAARAAVGDLVGRDTARLDAPACRRAAIESLAENLVDGFVSPVFWYVLVGLPGIVVFKVVSTMDSMVGYRTERYLQFGWCSARLDDLMNLSPARLTWLLIAGAAIPVKGCSCRKAARVGWQQHGTVPGPNAGWSEAAMAGAIQRRLVGPIWAGGVMVTDSWLGTPSDAAAGTAGDYRRATLVLWAAAGLSVLLAFGWLILCRP